MKKFLMPLIIGLCSCTSNISEEQVVEEDAKKVIVSIAEMNNEFPDSRVVIDDNLKFKWTSNDVIGIFPENKGSQVEFPIEFKEGASAEDIIFDGGGWAFKGGYSYAAYCPYHILNNKGSMIPFSYANQCLKKNGNDFDLKGNVLLVAGSTTVTNGSINFKLYNVESIIRIDLMGLPTDVTYSSLSLYAAAGNVIPLEKTYNIFSLESVKEGNTTVVSIVDDVVSKGNCLSMDLQDAVPVNGTIRTWIAFPAIGTSYGSLTAEVKDSNGKSYSGNVLVYSTGDPFQFDVKRHSKYAAKVTDFKQSEASVNGSINSWVSGGDFEATAQ